MIIQGLVPFIHPDYDKNRILGLPEYVYVKNPEDFANKMRELDEDDNKYRSLIEECFNCIKPEYLDGSYLVNNIMQKKKIKNILLRRFTTAFSFALYIASDAVLWRITAISLPAIQVVLWIILHNQHI